MIEIAGETLKTLNLATGGNGNKGQTINASEAPYDGFDYGSYVNVSTFATIQNTNPTNVTILYPTESLLISDGSVDLNVTWLQDVDNDVMTLYYYINGTLNSTSTGNSTFNASDGKYNLTVSLSDGTYLVNTSLNSFKIDTVFPVISGIPTNDSRVNIDTNYTITITDSNLYGANCSLYNGSNSSTNLLYSQEFTNIVSNSQQFLMEFNISN